MIEIENLCFAYDSAEVLHNICLSVADGAFDVVVGPNGGGKTTLLRLILGLIKPVYGRIEVMGMPPAKARRHMAYVPQALAYDSKFPVSVMDVVLMGRVDRHAFGPYGRADKEAANDALSKVGLADHGGRPFKSLSGGERQRVIVAQAIASQPRLMLLDEPGANLDPESRLQLYQFLATLTPGITILLVSHNLNVVTPVAEHIICVNRTAHSHRIEEISKDALENGAWAHLTHEHCPVADQDMAREHSPHYGKPGARR